jgi:tetratricopeptide (TPR) repeat protein
MPKPSDAELKWIEMFSKCLSLLGGNEEEGASLEGTLKQTLHFASSRFGPNHEYAAATLNLMGAACMSGGDHTGALRCFKEARQYAELPLDQWVRDVLLVGALSGVAAGLAHERNFTDAVRHYQKAISVAEQLPEMVAIDDGCLYLALAETSFLQGKYEDAVENYRRAAVVISGLHPDSLDFSRVANLYARTGLAYYLAGNLSDAEPLLDEVLNLRETHKLQTSPVMVAAINILAGIWRDRGNKENADLYLSWGLESCQTSYGMESSTSIHALNYSASYYLGEKDWSKAADCLRDALDYVDRVVECDEALWILKNLVAIAELQNDHKQLEKYEGALSVIYANQYSGKYRHDRSLVESGDKGAAAARMQLFQKAVDSVQARYDGKLHPQVAEVLKTADGRVWPATAIALAKLYASKVLEEKSGTTSKPWEKQEVQANSADLPPAEENTADPSGDAPAQAGQEQSEGEDWTETLARYLEQDKRDEAVSFLLDLMVRVESAEGKYSPNLMPLLESLSVLYADLGRAGDAQAARTRAQIIGCKVV